MKGIDFPIVNTKVKNSRDFYDLNDPEQRKVYFRDKAGPQIDDIADYLAENTFIAYLLGKKQAGKGTFSKLLKEIFGEDSFIHLSVGDLVRGLDEAFSNETKKAELMDYLEKNYRGFIPLDDAIDAFTTRNTQKLIPTEFILTLVKREIELAGKKTLFIDGFPRNMDQISYSLYFRELINYRNDMDLFVVIDIPEELIDLRIKNRRVCPKCHLSRNLTLFPTSQVEYDKETKEFFLICDNPACEPTRMVGKEGDDLGIDNIKSRLEMDDELIRKSFQLHGIPRILLRNTMPIELAESQVDPYEITPNTNYSLDDDGKVVMTESELTLTDDNGIKSYTLMAAAQTIEFINQLHKTLL